MRGAVGKEGGKGGRILINQSIRRKEKEKKKKKKKKNSKFSLAFFFHLFFYSLSFSPSLHFLSLMQSLARSFRTIAQRTMSHKAATPKIKPLMGPTVYVLFLLLASFCLLFFLFFFFFHRFHSHQ